MWLDVCTNRYVNSSLEVQNYHDAFIFVLYIQVKIIRTSDAVIRASEKNLISALNTASLLLPEKWTEEDLFMAIAGLSYSGDPRMTVGENPHKVRNIVKGSFESFQDLYHNILPEIPTITRLAGANFERDTSPAARAQNLWSLPPTLRSAIATVYTKTVPAAKGMPEEEALFNVAKVDTTAEYVTKGVQQIVSQSATPQTLKGLVTAGVTKSVLYGGNKLVKMFKGMMHGK
eukprot:Colp12_sorted_trinity150504_noHs@7058